MTMGEITVVDRSHHLVTSRSIACLRHRRQSWVLGVAVTGRFVDIEHPCIRRPFPARNSEKSPSGVPC